MLVKHVEGEGLERFHVTSATKLGVRYFVDLNEHFGNGECGCPQFQGRIMPKLREAHPKEGMKWGEEFRCKHLLAARQHLGDCLVDKYLEQRRKKNR